MVVFVATVDWVSDSGSDLSVHISTSPYVAAWAAVQEVAASWMDASGDLSDFVIDHPISTDCSKAELMQWLYELKEATTIPWVSLTQNPVLDSASVVDAVRESLWLD
jgi:hypothetical protein